LGKIFSALEKSKNLGNTSQPNPSREEIPFDIDKNLAMNPSKLSINSDSTFVDTDTYIINDDVNLDPCLISALKPHSPEAEQFRLLKNNILFPEKGVPPRSIMVTSTVSGEGKSFVSANLAVSIAQNIDEYVLLMDCDLRGPSIHSIFGLQGDRGLSSYLSEQVPLSSLFIKTFLNKLTVLPAGKIPPNPSELLSSEQMRRLIHELKIRYSDRYIIIDTPPPYITSEANAIARQVDGIIIVVKHGMTRKKDVLDIVNYYGREKILGVIYNHVKKTIGSEYSKYNSIKYGSNS
jgi:exopolysaccharide/PEP-CTERM locus tyrosine autokinase